MDSSCTDQIYSEEYTDFLVEHVGNDALIPQWYFSNCFQIASNRFAVVYMSQQRANYNNSLEAYVVPHVYGLLSSDELLEEIGVAQVQRQPNLSLYGQGVLIGFIDTGIDYTHPAFLNADGTSRIWSIWDQTILESDVIDGEKVYVHTPDGFDYGREYTTEDINEALASADPWSVVPSRDTNGHGTFMAGVACGDREEDRDFTGIAPLASICMVKCKEAKENLREYYQIQGDEPSYAENDIMLAVRYLWNQSIKSRMPLVICLGMGTNQGGHNAGGILGEMIQYYGSYVGTCVVTAAGNEANASHHYRSAGVEAGSSEEVELLVGPGKGGFSMELWSDTPNLYSIGLISPSGEYSGKTIARLGEKRTVSFLLEQTTVEIEYLLISHESGDECVRITFINPQEGIWRLRVFNDRRQNGIFHIWLPLRNFISDGTYFLQADPNTTICDPGNNSGVISVAYYDGENQGIATDSSRGYNRIGLVRPDIAAPGMNILGPLPGIGNADISPEERLETARYGYRSGSSAAAAAASGTAALLMEWGLVRRNDISMDTVTVQKYLIQGANPAGRETPNQLWGNGLLDLFGVFDFLRPK